MLIFLVPFIAYGYVEAKRIVVRKYTVYFDDLPEQFDGYSIIHLSDFHFTHCDGRVCEIEEYLKNLQADIAVMTGDFRYKNYTKTPGVFESMERIMSALRIRDGAYACLGNKDSLKMIPPFEKMGIKVLRNASKRIVRDRGELYLLGVDERNPCREFSTDAVDSLRNVPGNAFKVLLAHTPDYIKWARFFNIDLMLAGDTHGGQVRLPLFGPLRVKSRLSRKYCR